MWWRRFSAVDPEVIGFNQQSIPGKSFILHVNMRNAFTPIQPMIFGSIIAPFNPEWNNTVSFVTCPLHIHTLTGNDGVAQPVFTPAAILVGIKSIDNPTRRAVVETEIIITGMGKC